MKIINKIFKFLVMKSKYYILSFFNVILPKDKFKIYVFDRDFKKDNVWSLVTYISSEKKYSNFKIIYYTRLELIDFKNVSFVNRNTKAIWHQLTSKYIFYSYDEIAKMYPKKNQIILNTMHGSPLKNIGYLASESKFKTLWKRERDFTHILCVSDFFKEIIMKAYNVPEHKCLVLGYPRNDLLFKRNINFEELYSLDKYSNKIIWMPTWRRETKTGINRESDIEFPILNVENIGNISKHLKATNTLLVIKPHPFQTELDIFKNKYQNIKILTNEFLNENDIDLYSIFKSFDAMLTDYSSVYFDYLLLDKPIGFTLDDFDVYSEKRGFVVENPIEIMPGPIIKSYTSLIRFIDNIHENTNDFDLKRKDIKNLANKFYDNNSSKRISEELLKQ